MQHQHNRQMGLVRRLYDYLIALAGTRRAAPALAGVSFAESSFFPIPPDVLLIPMVLAKKRHWFFYATLCTLSSVAGAFLGYAIGAFFYETIAEPILGLYGKVEAFDKLAGWYQEYGGWGVFFAAVTPFPFKVLTIFSGATGLDIVTFAIVSLFGRGLRFFVVAALVRAFGAPMQVFIEQRLGIVLTLGVVLLIGGFALLIST